MLSNKMCGEMKVLALILVVVLLGVWLFGGVKESYRSPLYLNDQKLRCDNYPRSNGSLYGNLSHVLSGFPYYDKAY
jgi:hypothetical protein